MPADIEIDEQDELEAQRLLAERGIDITAEQDSDQGINAEVVDEYGNTPSEPEPTIVTDDEDVLERPLDELRAEAQGQPRGPDGKFLPKEGEPPAKADAPDPNAPPPTDPNAPPPETAPATEQFSFRGYKQDFTLDGALYRPGVGVLIPETQLPTLKRALARELSGKHDQVVARNHELEGRLQSVTTKADLEAKAVLEVLTPLLNDPNKLLEYAADPERGAALLRATLAEKKYQMHEEFGAMLATGQPSGETSGVDEAELGHHLDDALSTAFADPSVSQWIEPAERAEIAAMIEGNATEYLLVAEKDYPDLGLTAGDITLNVPLIQQTIRGIAAERQRTVQRFAPAQAVAASNAARTRTTVAAAPPTGARGATSAPPPKKAATPAPSRSPAPATVAKREDFEKTTESWGW